ncbi:MAG: DUF3021 domain-containing protein [Clostridia bacterium]|nr:DUF3021 domain-containing protein [Clostridia bacterium]
MKQNLFKFIHRGAIFGGFGPIIIGIVYIILSFTLDDFSVTGTEIFTAILSTYLLAFVHAGASVFNEIERWSVGRSVLCHFSVLYVAYSICYLINSWIPFDITVFLIFTGIFIVSYLIVWLTVYIIVKRTGRRLNDSLKKSK